MPLWDFSLFYSAGSYFRFQVLLYFMPITKTRSDRKDSLTVYSSSSLRAEKLNSEWNTEQLAAMNIHEDSNGVASIKGYMSANKLIMEGNF